jgi:hypothetical protein
MAADIRYVGEAASVDWRGLTFTRGQWVKKAALADADVALLSGNPTFEVRGDVPEIAAEPAPAPALPEPVE